MLCSELQDNKTCSLSMETEEIGMKNNEKSSNILYDKTLSSEEKLYLIFEINQEKLSIQFPALAYALLEWKDKHRKEIFTKNIEDYLDD